MSKQRAPYRYQPAHVTDRGEHRGPEYKPRRLHGACSCSRAGREVSSCRIPAHREAAERQARLFS